MELRRLFNNAQWADAERIAHTMKGLGSIFEIEGLPGVAASLVLALRERRLDAYLPLIDAFGVIFEKAIAAAGVLVQSNNQAAEPVAAAVSLIDIKAILPVIDALEASLASSGIEAVDMAAALHRQFGMGAIKNLVGTLVEQTAEFDYGSAAQTLKGIR